MGWSWAQAITLGSPTAEFDTRPIDRVATSKMEIGATPCWHTAIACGAGGGH